MKKATQKINLIHVTFVESNFHGNMFWKGIKESIQEINLIHVTFLSFVSQKTEKS